MLPKVDSNANQLMPKRENIASQIIVNDHLKNMLAKSKNNNYKVLIFYFLVLEQLICS